VGGGCRNAAYKCHLQEGLGVTHLVWHN